MTNGALAPAQLPPPGISGLLPEWSRLVTVPDLDGPARTFHVLDNQVPDPSMTLLCVHGNPSWSYLWRDVIATAPQGVRVIAPDHLDMGFSERTGSLRRLAQRIDDLDALTSRLHLAGPVVIVAHDWGGPISLGWAQRHLDMVAGVVLANTAVHQPEDAAAPRVIRIIRTPGVLGRMASDTAAFVRGALALSRSTPPPEVKEGYLAPYLTPDRRTAIADFVADIPLEPGHPSAAPLKAVADGLEAMAGTPVLLLWGPDDPVFSDLYLHDLEARLPHADVHRFSGARHYVPEEADVAKAVHMWTANLGRTSPTGPARPPRPRMIAALDRLRSHATPAIVEMTGRGPGRTASFGDLADDVTALAAGLHAAGIQRGTRVALLVPPGVDLAACVYACWRIGAVTVVADAGLGLRGMGRALQSAAPDYLIGVRKALAAARALRWPGTRISVESLPGTLRRTLGVSSDLDELRATGSGAELPPPPDPEDLAAVAFTSGATGPAKGVRYRHRQLEAQRDALIDLYDIGPGDRLVAAFAPFALYGPAMGITSTVPAMDVTKPGSLRARGLAAAVRAVDATLVFASPAALANVAATKAELTDADSEALGRVRLLLSAGAPVAPQVLQRAAVLMPAAEPHTPYGMTECLPVADITLDGIETADNGWGVCVGPPLSSVDVAIDALDDLGRPCGTIDTTPDVTGEVCVRAPHMRDGYDRLWMTDHAASQPPGWHRTGDVGHLDAEGRLWIEGRLGHVITTAGGPVTPVGIEHSLSAIAGVDRAAVVGVGPEGTQQVVAVVVPPSPPRRPQLADLQLHDAARNAASVEIAAVFVAPSLPVDRRHNSKVDRTRIAAWAEQVLAGDRIGAL